MSFLSEIQKKYGKGGYEGDQFGGAAGHDSSGLPADNPGNFMFATGIECSYPTIKNGKVRRDQLRECDHYDRYKEDLGLVKEMGLNVLRYGLPYYSMHLGPGKYDWEFADLAMAEIKRLGITPILDLMHFGVPDWLGNFQNPELPVHFADFCAAVARRYPWVRYYTPVNEIYVTARISGKDGNWNEQLKTDKGFVTALKHCVAASIMGNQQIAKHRPDCVIVQSESAEYTHELLATPSAETKLNNELRFLSLDLLYANPPSANVGMYMMDNGLTRKEYDWFMAGKPPGYQVMGNDYYGRNERIKLPDGSIQTSMDVLGWYKITSEYYKRYHLPVMHTETNVFEPELASEWLYKQWLSILQMRRDGVPVIGFTWYSLTDQIDWDSQLTEENHNVNACGLYDLNRKPRPVAEAYKTVLKEFGQITVVPYAEMLEITDRPAQLKVNV
ncbi:MAG: glycoside hydrolase family 1 protein [Spirosoma sp.]|nr:glycoside hydrolase family 1 protein [Spirosoma sp.]